MTRIQGLMQIIVTKLKEYFYILFNNRNFVCLFQCPQLVQQCLTLRVSETSVSNQAKGILKKETERKKMLLCQSLLLAPENTCTDWFYIMFL